MPLKNRILRFGLFPLLVYFAIFCVLTFPAITRFGSQWYADSSGDAIQNLWNFWHVRQSIATLQSPYHTSMLFYPEGTTLLAQTLSPTNSFLGAGLSLVLTPYQAYNTVMILAVVLSGLSGFLIAYYFSRSYWPSIVGGFIYGFSGFAMLHLSYGRINLMSLEWVPLFLIFWHKLLTRPSLKRGLLASLFLILTAYTDLYYLFFACFTAAIFLAVFMFRNGWRRILDRRYLVPLALFGSLFLLAFGPFLLALISAELKDPFIDAHPAATYSIDLLAPFLPGFLKGWYSSRLSFGEGAGEGLIGVTVLALAAYVVIKRKQFGKRFPLEWLLLLGIGFLYSLGPVLHVYHHTFGNHLIMPYTVFQDLLPFLRLAGMPDRIMALTTLAAAVIAAVALSRIMNRKRGWLLLVLIATAIGVEYLPARALPAGVPPIPGYVTAIESLPDKAPVYDYYPKENPVNMLYQTLDDHPIVGGFISRRTRSVFARNNEIKQSFADGDYSALCGDGFKYLVVDASVDLPGARLLYSGQHRKLYDLSGYSKSCTADLTRTSLTNYSKLN
ncbi:MAG: hypothetical protein M0Z32_03195 [Actinomycetota bacterium]|nr:hypothetical protein [Actinomycetota bacterium]MCL6094120.1 hypothetical protein [Actinomycetota bacterium]MDA8166744.1 hypothetical protein [Actinomycetota bacterium]